MPLYKYEARNLDGKVIKGKINSENEEELRRLLKKRGYYLISVKNDENLLNFDLAMLKKIPDKDISILCREMYFSLSSGITIIQTLEIVKDQIENKKLKYIIKNVHEEVEKGKMLSEAFKKYGDLPNLFIYMIEVGEATGRLDEVMIDMADYYDKQYKQKRKINNALIYPKFLIIFSIVVVTALVSFIVPIFVKNLLDANGKLPIPTRIVIFISNFIKFNWLYLFGVITLLFIIKILFVNKNKSYIYIRDKLIVNSKFIGTVSSQIMTARFARTFSILFAGGISVIRCIEITANVIGNEYVKGKLLEAKQLINNGVTIGESIEIVNIFPKMLIQSIKVGEESGSVDKILKKAANFYDSEANFTLEKLTNLIEPIMIVILALIVGFVVISIILPTFSMYDAIQ